MIYTFDTYLLRKEEFGAIVFDKSNYCFSLIGKEHLEVIINGSQFTDPRNKPLIGELVNSGYYDEKRSTYLPSLIPVTEFDAKLLRAPIAVGILVNSQCNQKCVYCYAKCHSNTEISLEDIGTVKKTIISSEVLACWISGGEPTLWPHLINLIDLFTNCNIHIAIDSNGSNSSCDILAEALKYGVFVRISLDSHIAGVHNEVRGNFSSTISTIKRLTDRDSKIGIITVVHALNAKYLKELCFFLQGIGVKRWTLLQLNDLYLSQPQKKGLCVSDRFFEKVTAEAVEYAMSLDINTTVIRSNQPRSTLLLGPDGKYYTVVNDKGEVETLGDLSSTTIEEIWARELGISRINHLRKYLGTGFLF